MQVFCIEPTNYKERTFINRALPCRDNTVVNGKLVALFIRTADLARPNEEFL